MTARAREINNNLEEMQRLRDRSRKMHLRRATELQDAERRSTDTIASRDLRLVRLQQTKSLSNAAEQGEHYGVKVSLPRSTNMVHTLTVCLALVVFSSLAEQSEAGAVTSTLQVQIPTYLTRAGTGYEHREGLFGVPPYGGAIQQNVYYADQDMCDSNVDATKGYPSRKDGAVWPSPYILMVDRGGCSFVKKVRNAQRSGAAGVLIADSKCLCSAGEACTPDEAEKVCEMKEPIMADDGSGSDISIPSFLLFKEDADPIRDVLKSNKPVRIEMTWVIPSKDDRVEYDLFTTPTDVISRPFQDHFKAAALALGKHATFTPHMYIYDGIKAGCQGHDGQNECHDLCTNSGRYCATDPDDDLGRGISGADVVTESLRRACIWNTYGADGVGEPWWKYVEQFRFRCKKEDLFASDECLTDVYTNSGVSKAEIDACMLESGGLEGDLPNTVLEAQLGECKAWGVAIVPSMYVNSAAIRGALGFATVFKAVCAGFETGSEPDICQKCANCLDEYGCVTHGKCMAGGFSGDHSGLSQVLDITSVNTTATIPATPAPTTPLTQVPVQSRTVSSSVLDITNVNTTATIPATPAPTTPLMQVPVQSRTGYSNVSDITNVNTTATIPATPSPTTPAPTTPVTQVPVQSWTGSSNVSDIMTDITKPKVVISETSGYIPEPKNHHKNAAPSCNTLSCKGLAVLNDHPLLYIFLFMVLSTLCFFRCNICSRGQSRDSRGEYRAVGRMLANNFDTELSDEDMDIYPSDDDDDDNGDGNGNGWSGHGKGSIELGSIGAETNGGLTLEEMNG